MAYRDDEIAAEQVVVDRIYTVLRATRRAYRTRQEQVAAQPAAGSPQNRSERDAQAAHYGDQARRLEQVEDRLVFGRLDSVTHETTYIGRVGLSDEDHTPLLVDWRARKARPFYQATAAHPGDVARRRHLFTRGDRVCGVEDEVFDVAAATEAGLTLQGEGALMAALSEGRSGRMGDIVATIQAEQDLIIRADTPGLLVVQGGPGTGKTAVALHRAAYLLYAEADRLARSGILIVGPSTTFLRYIDQVLPTLGETGVVSTTIGTLLPGIVATGTDSPTVAALKGDMRWVTILKAATRSLERVPAEPLRFHIDGVPVHVTPTQVRAAITHARHAHRTHNDARATFVADVLQALTDSYARAVKKRGQVLSEGDRGWVYEELRTHKDVRREVNLCWMPYTPERLLRRLFARPDLLRQVAGRVFTDAEIAALTRSADAPLTPADVVLIAELRHSLGDFVDPREHARQVGAAREERHLLDQARETLQNAGLETGLIQAEHLVARASGALRGDALAERARLDPDWTYGHIVVDEAQELSPLAWHVLLRRCPSRSFTVVGDLAQRHVDTDATSWVELLGPAERAFAAEHALTVCYRTPATIMEAAERVQARAGRPSPYPPRPVRDLPDALALTELDALTGATLAPLVDAELARLDERLGAGGGTLAVIAPTGDVAPLRAATGWGQDTVTDRVSVIDAATAKGLEFDTVVLVDPARIGRDSLGDLYVAMTRPTSRLHVAHTGDLPDGLESR